MDIEPGDRESDCGGIMKPVCLPPFPLERIEEMTKLMEGDGSLKF